MTATPELYIGVYDHEGGGGLIPLTRTIGEANWQLGKPDPSIRNASYGVFSQRRGIHFIIDERNEGQVCAYCFRNGRFTKLQVVSSAGRGPCFVALNADETALAVANYDSGSVASFRVDQDGIISGPTLLYENRGCGPLEARQRGPHAHCVRFFGERLYSTDLGTDEILMHVAGADPSTTIALKMPGGQGPRHILFHPTKPLAYVLTELGNRIFTLRVCDDGKLEHLHQVSTLMTDPLVDSTAAHLALNEAGTRLYASNRGDDSIVVFDLGADGTPEAAARAPTGGRGPRHFCLLEDQASIVVAHQTGDRITVLDMGANGRPGEVRWSADVPQAAFVGHLGTNRY